MTELEFSRRREDLRILCAICFAALLAASLAIATSLNGWPQQFLRFESASLELPVDAHIDGRASFDKPSYFTGETAAYRLRILYRSDTIKPDLSGLKDRISFLPFELISVREDVTDGSNGIRIYEAEYLLQVAEAKSLGYYEFDSPVLYYTQAGKEGIVQSLRIHQPNVRIASYYPSDIAGVDLLEVRGKISDRTSIRQWLLGMAGAIFAIGSLYVLRRFGRRRSRLELSEAERLWFQFNDFRNETKDNREQLANFEQLFTQVLQQRLSMHPDAFWSGATPEDASWAKTVSRGRQLLRKIYQPPAPRDDDVQEMQLLLATTLSPLVDEARLKREMEPGFAVRLLQQPGILAVAAGMAAASALALSLAHRPSAWQSPDLERYNEAVVNMLQGRYSTDEPQYAEELSKLGEESRVKRIRTAALYNAGTLRANRAFAALSRSQRKRFLQLIHQADSAEGFLHTVLQDGLAGSEEELVVKLLDAAEELQRSELELRKAARIQADGQTILRNLELVARTRHAVLERLVQLRDLFRPKTTGESDFTSQYAMVNVIESELPEEYKTAVGKDDVAYLIYERF